MPAVNCTAQWRTKNATGGGCRTAEQNRIGAVTQRTRLQWKLGVRGRAAVRQDDTACSVLDEIHVEEVLLKPTQRKIRAFFYRVSVTQQYCVGCGIY